MDDHQEALDEKEYKIKIHHHHHSSGFWALILITVGLVFLLNNFDILPWSVWGTIWRFWPVLLILAGIQVILGKSRASSIVVFLLGLLIIAVIVFASVASVNSAVNNYMNNQLHFQIPMHDQSNYRNFNY
ncbi:DUF5668 domain-containing protein [Patescibacteria group bacterium]|nr:DUF5668 domain-containing protein [Patescibacteria group bacterium]MCL5409831.1 DUF5668 domain-containing protein [Patescibacteria group bacterium]